MSYNIDIFNVKKMENLQIPVASFYKSSCSDWHPIETIDRSTGLAIHTFEIAELVTVSGSVVDDKLHVISIDCCGEGSGFAWDEILQPVLEDSTGIFSVSCVWEGGDSINRFDVVDGVITSTDIEI